MRKKRSPLPKGEGEVPSALEGAWRARNIPARQIRSPLPWGEGQGEGEEHAKPAPSSAQPKGLSTERKLPFRCGFRPVPPHPSPLPGGRDWVRARQYSDCTVKARKLSENLQTGSNLPLLKTSWTLLIALLTSVGAFGADARTNSPPPRVYRDKVEPHWFAGADGRTNRFWYRVETAEDRHEFVLVDALAGTRVPAFDHARLAQAISQRTGKPFKPDGLPFDSLKFLEDGKSARLIAKDTNWLCNLETYELKEEPKEATLDDAKSRRTKRDREPSSSNKAAQSPDGRWEAVVRGHNLFLRDSKTKKEEPLTYDGNPNNSYARDVQRQQGVEMEYDAVAPVTPEPEVYWSPDSQRLVAMRTRPGTQRKVFLIESSPEDQLQPKLTSYPYLKPGDEIPVSKPHLFEINSRKEILLDEALFLNPWSISDLRWAPDSSRFTFLYNQRGHQVLRIVAVDANTGDTRSIVDERSPTFVDYSGKFFCEYLDKTGEIVWMSERDGWNHLYLYDALRGTVKSQITRGNWVVRGVDHVDEEKRQVWFHAGGIHSEQDPYFIYYCRVNLDGSGLTLLTTTEGTHDAQFSPDRRLYVDTWSRVDSPPVTELRRGEDGKLVCKLEVADAGALLAGGWRAPESFVARGRDGEADIYGVIYRPEKFGPARKYPVIECIYAGPQDAYAPKSFRASRPPQELANRGFIVVQMDGMGTSNRSKKFHDVCWKNLGDAGFPDRILWIKAAAAKYPFMDLTRVGIYGTSAGGQNALRGLLTHGDFYTAGVADSGCHDNRMDKIWWNEQWMGWPVGPEYDEQSNVTQAGKLTGKLLLMVGELDKNVDPASTMQVVNALIKADKDFELLVMPGAGHGVARTAYGRRRLEEFFVRNLADAPPVIEKRQANAAVR